MKLAQELKKLVNEDLDSSYVVFGFEGKPDLANDHVTLMYFGKIEEDKVQEIISLIDSYMEENKPKEFEAVFDKVSMFGPENDVRVLEAKDKNVFLIKLRELLAPYNGSKFTDFNPHYTNDSLDSFTGIIDRLQFSQSEYKEIKTWNLGD